MKGRALLGSIVLNTCIFRSGRCSTLVCCLVLVASTEPLAVANPPNVVLIVADDLGYGDLGCYGSVHNETPHIDRLAAGGIRLADFHSAGPMCTPTRAAMLTGLYQQRFGKEFDTALAGDSELGLPLEAITIAEILPSRDYATACFGKWHLSLGHRKMLPTRSTCYARWQD